MKLEWTLVPWHAMTMVCSVMTKGKEKHDGVTWHLSPATSHIDAALRHITTHLKGTVTDEETGEYHLAHAVCRLLFAIHLIMFSNIRG